MDGFGLVGPASASLPASSSPSARDRALGRWTRLRSGGRPACSPGRCSASPARRSGRALPSGPSSTRWTWRRRSARSPAAWSSRATSRPRRRTAGAPRSARLAARAGRRARGRRLRARWDVLVALILDDCPAERAFCGSFKAAPKPTQAPGTVTLSLRAAAGRDGGGRAVVASAGIFVAGVFPRDPSM